MAAFLFTKAPLITKFAAFSDVTGREFQKLLTLLVLI
jgi:hypothetical protein